MGANEGIVDVDSYGLYNFKNIGESHIYNIWQTIYDIDSYGLFSYKESSINSLFKTGTHGVTKLFYDIDSYGLFGYKETGIEWLFKDNLNIYGVKQHDSTIIDKTAYSLHTYSSKNSTIDKFPTILPDIKFIRVKQIIIHDVTAYGLHSYKETGVEWLFKDNLNKYGSKIMPNFTNRYSYGLFGYKESSINSLFKTGNYGINQYDPTAVDKISYGLFNNNNIDIGVFRGIAYTYPKLLGVEQEFDASQIDKTSYGLYNYKYYYAYGFLKIWGGVKQYDATKVDKTSYGLYNYGQEDIYQDEANFTLTKQTPKNIVSYGLFNYKGQETINVDVEQAVPKVNIISYNANPYLALNPGHDATFNDLALLMFPEEDEGFPDNQQKWKPSFSPSQSCKIYNTGMENLLIYGIEIEYNSPLRIINAKLGGFKLEDISFPYTIPPNFNIQLKWWLYVDWQEETAGIVDGINDTPANETDDYFDDLSTTPTFLIYTNDPLPDPADVEHVLITGGSHPHDGQAEWKLESHWSTYWGESAGSIPGG